MADSSKVTVRKLSNGGVDRPLTYDELDVNFLQLISVINDFNSGSSAPTPTVVALERILDISASLLENQSVFDPGVQDVFTVTGQQLSVPLSTILYTSPIIEINNNDTSITVLGMNSGGIKVRVKGYNATGNQITGSTDSDYTINGTSFSFVTSQTFSPSSDTDSTIIVSFTTTGKSKAKFYSIVIESAPTNPLVFTLLKVRG